MSPSGVHCSGGGRRAADSETGRAGLRVDRQKLWGLPQVLMAGVTGTKLPRIRFPGLPSRSAGNGEEGSEDWPAVSLAENPLCPERSRGERLLSAVLKTDPGASRRKPHEGRAVFPVPGWAQRPTLNTAVLFISAGHPGD